MTHNDLVALDGSYRKPPPHPPICLAPEDEVIHVTVYLRDRAAQQLSAHAEQLTQAPPAGQKPLTRAEFAQKFGAQPADIEAVRQFAEKQHLNVVAVHPERRSVELSGTVAAMNDAFGVELQLHRSLTGVYRAHSGSVHVPRALAGVVVGVLGLDARPVATPHFKVRQTAEGNLRPAALVAGSFTPREVANLYQFPPDATGAGQCVALIELGGGYIPADVEQYFTDAGITPPTIIDISAGAQNTPGQDADGEVQLDIEVVGAVAPGAKIAVYFGANTAEGFIAAIFAAVHDFTNNPNVISISWGGPEENWASVEGYLMDQAFTDAILMGVSVFVATGDKGSSDGVTDGQAHVDWPAASALVIACGGTSVQAAGGQIISETVWNDVEGATGGGVSRFTPVPSYQQAINPTPVNPPGPPGRGLPDVAGNADPETGYQISVNGQKQVTGGTSAVAPLWAALTALIQQSLGHSVSPLWPTLYSAPTAFRDITEGNNGVYFAGPGWDPCTGVGTPIGTALLAALSTTPAAAPKKTTVPRVDPTSGSAKKKAATAARSSGSSKRDETVGAT